MSRNYLHVIISEHVLRNTLRHLSHCEGTKTGLSFIACLRQDL